MMPPECAVCGADATPPGGLVNFRSRAEDLLWRGRAERTNLGGHPPDTAWLCAEHVAAGRDLADESTLPEAMQRLRDAHSETPTRSDSVLAIAPVAIEVFGARLRALAGPLAQHLGIALPTIAPVTTRRWHPMDGAVAPDCPFVDDTRWTPADSALGYSGSRSWWSEGVLARADESLVIRTPSVSVSLSAHVPPDGSTVQVGEILIHGTLPSSVADLVTREFAGT